MPDFNFKTLFEKEQLSELEKDEFLKHVASFPKGWRPSIKGTVNQIMPGFKRRIYITARLEGVNMPTSGYNERCLRKALRIRLTELVTEAISNRKFNS